MEHFKIIFLNKSHMLSIFYVNLATFGPTSDSPAVGYQVTVTSVVELLTTGICLLTGGIYLLTGVM